MARGSRVGCHLGAVVVSLAIPLAARAQGTGGQVPPPAAALSMDAAVRLALERNQTLRAQRLTIDESKADEITAALKPNLSLSALVDGMPIFSPSHLTGATFRDNVTYGSTLSYTFERGGKRDKRLTVAEDTTGVATKTVEDAERLLRFQTEQAFINVLLAKSTLDIAQQNLKDFSDVVELNRQRVTSGDLAEADFLKISIQKLQFETDVSSAEVGLVQAKAALRQIVGFEAVTDDFDVTGDLTHTPQTTSLDDLKREALASRPDLQAAARSLILAQHSADLARGNRARDVTGSVDYSRNGFGSGNNTVGVGASFELPIHDRNQGNIAHADIAVRQATETEAATRFGVMTDVVTAFAAYQTNEKVLKLYESGYLDQARQSLDISTYAFGRGAASLLDLLDAERTYRDTQIAYRQALAAYMTSVRQLNFAVGKQVMP
jgi:cobalt-zinc-cadmium efflux system outer membrane protein